MWRPLVLSSLLTGLAGCGAADAVAEAPEYDPEGQTKCAVTKSASEPLIIEWPATQRAKLEAMAARGAIAVRYDGCEMEVMAGCRVPRDYDYTATTRQKEHINIKDEDELYARLPLGAARLSANLEKAGELNVSMTIVGTFETDRSRVHRDELSGACGGATHVVDALIVGAFKFYAGAAAEIGAEGGVGDIGGGAKSTSEKSLLRSAGDEDDCEESTDSDEGPPDGCGALLRVEVTAIASARPRSPVAAPEPPPEPAAPKPPSPDPAPVAQPSVDPDANPLRPAPRQPAPATADTSAPSFTPYQQGSGWNYETGGATWYYWLIGGLGGAVVIGAVIGGVVAAQSAETTPESGDLGSATVSIPSFSF